jgi:XTP/dITP diphosphohydrolase
VRLLLATGNAHKVAEVAAILGAEHEVVAADPDVAEDGDTFAANALIKARAVRDRTGHVAIADDSGLVVDALDGRPGIHSARWTAEHDWIPRVLRELEAQPGAPRTARFVCAAAVAWPDGREAVVTGAVEGVIADAPQGSGGFGYDPIFVPDEGDGRTFGAMAAAEKQALSHRGRAFRALGEQLDGAL